MVGFGSAWTLLFGLAILNDITDPHLNAGRHRRVRVRSSDPGGRARRRDRRLADDNFVDLIGDCLSEWQQPTGNDLNG